ncbi:DivIVA domain-containing protein [Cryobacterium sp. Hz9]|uniref:DivIVA domain-containing protein n=1 Tax=Cryobacterium sp. Hz9 TaxID=1259167 RepID=UPI00106B2782|nr:DivIVA domain-containing protein [Cryobacterium sp. Hz9]TFB64094.1 DivIVA domain-containing protein [Cryobacterium sp. Hz9]
MSTIFPRVGRKSLGYNVTQVETFLDAARRAYDQPDDDELDADTGVVESVDTIAASGEPNRTVSGASVPDDTRVFPTADHQKVETKASRGSAALTAEGIRHTAFAMHKDGYSPDHVDAALERLEDAFAARERDQATRAGGEQAWMADAESAANVLVARLSRPPGQRFTRASVLAVGYKKADVDRLANKLVKHFRHGHELTVDEVRTAVFRPERGGYREAQVDLVLDSAVDVMLAVR